MNTRLFRRVVGALLVGSLPLAAALSGQLGCNNCYPGGSGEDIEYFALPPYVPPPVTGCVDCGSVDAGMTGGSPGDGGLADGGLADGGVADGGTRGPPIPSLQEQCETLCMTQAQLLKNPYLGAAVHTEGTLGCDCDFGSFHFDAYCVPPGAIPGRRPADFVPVQPHGTEELKNFFAHALQGEAASVAAFRILAQELRVHRAPRHLAPGDMTTAARLRMRQRYSS